MRILLILITLTFFSSCSSDEKFLRDNPDCRIDNTSGKAKTNRRPENDTHNNTIKNVGSAVYTYKGIVSVIDAIKCGIDILDDIGKSPENNTNKDDIDMWKSPERQ